MSPIEGREDGSEWNTGPPGPATDKGRPSKLLPPSLSVQETLSPSPSAQAPSSPSLSVEGPPVGSPFDKNCPQLPGPGETQGDRDHLTHDERHQLWRRPGFARQGREAALKTRLSTMDAVERKCVGGTEASQPGETLWC